MMEQLLPNKRLNNASRDDLNFKIRVKFIPDQNLGWGSVCSILAHGYMYVSMCYFIVANQCVGIWEQGHLIKCKFLKKIIIILF